MSTKDQRIKDFLQTKRAPLDEWNTLEQLCLASAVACSGDQNWMSVSRALKGMQNLHSARPADWFIAKSCATQYGKLLESVDTPKRKKRTASERDQPTEAPSTPIESLVKKLTDERIVELKKAIHDEQQEYLKLKEEILFLQSNTTDETKVREMWNQIEQEKLQKENEQVRHDQWLKEREEKKREHERQWRGSYKVNTKAQKSSSQEEVEPDTTTQQLQQGQQGQQAGTSPLLTSLLKSPSQAQTTVQQPSVSSTAAARVAPTITNLLTGTSSSASPIITQIPSIQSSTSAQNILINASASMVPNIIKIDHSASSSIVSHSQSAPTLINLLDKKSSTASATVTSSSQQDASTSEKQQLIMSMSAETGGKDGDIVKDEEAELLADFNELIDSEKFDIDEDLEDLNSIIMNPEILEEKNSDGEPIKDADDSSQATSTDDYDKLKIKQIVETIQRDFAGGVPEVDTPPVAMVVEEAPEPMITTPSPMEVTEIIQVPSEAENSEPASVEMIDAPMESNDSTALQTKVESPIQEEKVVMISDESSNTTDEKKDEVIEKMDIDGEESQSVKSSAADEIKDASGEDSNQKDAQEFQGIQINESDENSVSSEKEMPKEPIMQLDDSEDAIFEDAKENQSGSEKAPEADPVAVKEQSPEKSLLPEIPEAKPTKPVVIAENEEASRSAIDSDDEVLEVKISRSTSRKKATDSLKADTPSSSTRSRDHSENDDNRDSTPIRTRSRHSSTAVSEPKSTFNFSKEQDHSMWKARWDDCAKEIQRIKEFSQIFDNKILQDDFYKKVCLHPMNMKLIGKNIETHISTLPTDIKRDFILMCTNIIMLNTKGTKFNEMVHQFSKDAVEIIESHMDVEDSYKSYRKQIKKKSS